MKKTLFNLSLLPLKGVNSVFDLTVGGKRRPVFLDIDQTYPSLRLIDQSYPAIRDEMLQLLPDKDVIPRYHELDAGQTEISADTASVLPSSERINPEKAPVKAVSTGSTAPSRLTQTSSSRAASPTW